MITVKQMIDHIYDEKFLVNSEWSERKVKELQEVYTTNNIASAGMSYLDHYIKDPDQPFVDPEAGIGNLLCMIHILKVKNGVDFETSLKSLYGVEINPESVEICKSRLLVGQEKYRHIVDNNIREADSLKYNYRWDDADPYLSNQDIHNQNIFEIE